MTAPRIEVKEAQVVRQGRMTLDVDHLAVASSEIVAVVGPNGAGKSTLAQVMGLLLRPSRGSVSVAGEIVSKKREHALRQKLACVFQSPHLLDTTVRANVELGMRLRGVQPMTRRRRADRWIHRLGLDHLARNRAKTLSGGEAQRVNLARALSLKPDVLLLDEPFGGLDAPTRHSLMEELGPLIREGAASGLLVTHDRRVALALCDRVAVMLDGRIRQIGPPDDVFSFPVDEETARFVGVENLIPAMAEGTELRIENQCCLTGSAKATGPVTIALRADEVRLVQNTKPNPEINLVPGVVKMIHRSGVAYAVELDVGFRLISRLSRTDLAQIGCEEGGKAMAAIRPGALHLINKDR